ncbi:hypothetical protein IGB42_02042 [Andreprevotia sp. IGB-42]|uniref:hypothetical protein n=1 Tax=Andreprevotia sp. IGB-42 TaxID=2497473 RepID=UPI00135A74FB|nr:hypothetical protein [Andreprevotia sp. IGB-42]KAF0813689.1 hypothetical protein IGB42_02042 [Andreprevotia sp. IGB-42]
MKKFVALGVLFFGVMLNASASEVQYFRIYGNQIVGPDYCSQEWPGSTFNGLRQGMGDYYFISCIKY